MQNLRKGIIGGVAILVSLMAISLVGIIIIQYTWIRKTVEEKQALIDNQVYESINNIDHKLNNFRTFSFFSDTLFKQVIEPEGDIQTNIIINSEDNHEIRIISKLEQSIENSTETINIEQFNYRTDSLTIVQVKHEIHKAENVLDKIKFELISEDGDSRLDSIIISDLLIEEFTANHLGQPIDWSIYDLQEKVSIVTPSTKLKSDYSIPLFTSDIISPGRYQFNLSLNNKTTIWKEIWIMVLLSVLFLLIMTFVFAYSIRLAIKHKNISKIKSDFINNMTHEFKTPLASISLASDSILHPNTNFEPEAIKKYIKIIQGEKSKLNLHVERILEVASLNKDALNIPSESVDLKAIINNSINKLALLIDKEKATISFNCDKSISIIANQHHLENVFVNLIENGIKYSNLEAKINIGIEVSDQTVVVKVTDQGIGMSKTQLQKAFDNFYRVESGNIHNTKGFGLGLSYCKLVVEKMGGLIQLKSELKKGTTVELKFKKA